jgi:hypothetical protein
VVDQVEWRVIADLSANYLIRWCGCPVKALRWGRVQRLGRRSCSGCGGLWVTQLTVPEPDPYDLRAARAQSLPTAAGGNLHQGGQR